MQRHLSRRSQRLKLRSGVLSTNASVGAKPTAISTLSLRLIRRDRPPRMPGTLLIRSWLMPPQRSRPRDYSTSVDPDALHIEPEKLQGFGDAREVLKKAEVDQLRAKAARADELEAQLNQALAEQGQSSTLLVQEDGALIVQGFQFS